MQIVDRNGLCGFVGSDETSAFEGFKDQCKKHWFVGASS